MKACPNCQATYPTNYTHCPRDGASLIEAGAWREGTVVRGKYRILAKVGQGGMATVYKAAHTRFNELRALKVINAELAHDVAFVKRFTQEAVLTRKLQHPNAVRVDDIDEADDGRPFIVMEYTEGQSLKDVIQKEAPMPVARVCSTAVQVAAALEAAHRLGIVHRDIKPANIMLLDRTVAGSASHPILQWPDHPVAKVLDFGIAKAREVRADDTKSQLTLTDTGHIIGTPAYMSPEQARGMKGDQLDGRSDLYSLGIVMYQMLAGGLPFEADTSMEWMLAHIQTPPKPLWETRQGLEIPPAVASAVMRCLEKDRQLRPESAAALIEELNRAGQFAPEPVGITSWRNHIARRHETPAPPTSPIRGGVAEAPVSAKPSRSWVRWAAVAAALVLVAGAIVAWRTQRRAWPWSASQRINPGASQAGSPKESNGGSASPATDTPTVPDASGDVTDADLSSAKKTTPVAIGKAASPGHQGDGLARDSEIADAVSRAADDEKQGNFEDALKEYERASKLDSSDVRLKRDIQRLRDRIQKEKELIQ